MKKTIILAFIIFLSVCNAMANTPLLLSGSVKNSEGKAIPYATIVIKEKNEGVAADRDGNFYIPLPDSKTYTLSVHCVGYVPAEITVSAKTHKRVECLLDEDLMNIHAVVVTGTRTPKLLKDMPVQTRIITAQDIRRLDATNIGDLLQAELPSIEFSYSMNQQTSLNMQGFGGTSVLFLVDGERMAGETLDNVDYSRLDLNNVERVEIVRGSASSLYGSNAVGGVINIITADATKPWALNINTLYGSHNRQRHGAVASFSAGRVSSVTDFQYNNQDSYSLGTSGDYTMLYGNRSYTVKEKLGIRVSDRFKLTAKGGYYFRERDTSRAKKNRYRDFSGGLRMNYDIASRQSMEAAYNFDQYDKSDFYPMIDKDIRSYSNRQHNARVVYNLGFAGGHTLTVGGDGLYDYIMSYQFSDSNDYSQYAVDAFVQFDWRVSRNVNLVGGIRADYFSGQDVIDISPRLTAMYKPGNFALRASYSRGFRAPTLKEMYMEFDMAGVFMIYGNPDLKSETSNNFIISGEYQHRYFNATVSAYYNMVDNHIGTVWNTALNGMEYTNIRKMNILGTEANFRLKLPCGFGTNICFAYTESFHPCGVTKTDDTRPFAGILRLEYGRTRKDDGFNIALMGMFKSAVDTNQLTAASKYQSYEKAHYPGYMLWKLVVSERFWRSFTLNVTIDNLLDYKPDYFFYNSPATYGTMFSVGLSVNIEEIFGS